MMTKLKRMIGKERLVNGHLQITNAQVLDFWRFGFSDLKANNTRGILAEWIVAKLLKTPISVRDSWAEWDLCFKNCRLEIKASAYLQTWKQKGLSRIVFTGLKKRRLNQETNQYAKIATYNADWYVFCVPVEQKADKWDALDLDQWRFYILPQSKLGGRKSISLQAVKSMSQEMTASEFQREARRVIVPKKTLGRNQSSVIRHRYSVEAKQ